MLVRRRWQSAGRYGAHCVIIDYRIANELKFTFRDILNELASVGDIPLPDAGANIYNKNKRERGSDEPVSSSSQLAQSSMIGVGDQRPIAGRKSLVGTTQLGRHPQQPQALGTSPAASLPSGLPYGTEQLGGLGRVPMQWTTGAAGAPAAAAQAAAGGVYGAAAQTAMPDINIFDMYNTSEQQMNYIPMMDQGYGAPPASSQQQQQQHRAQHGQQQQANVMQGNYMAMEGQMAPMTEALNMWSRCTSYIRVRWLRSVFCTPADELLLFFQHRGLGIVPQ